MALSLSWYLRYGFLRDSCLNIPLFCIGLTRGWIIFWWYSLWLWIPFLLHGLLSFFVVLVELHLLEDLSWKAPCKLWTLALATTTLFWFGGNLVHPRIFDFKAIRLTFLPCVLPICVHHRYIVFTLLPFVLALEFVTPTQVSSLVNLRLTCHPLSGMQTPSLVKLYCCYGKLA